MCKKHTFQTKMAKEYQCIFIWFLYSVIMSFTHISMLCQKLVKFPCHIVIITLCI